MIYKSKYCGPWESFEIAGFDCLAFLDGGRALFPSARAVAKCSLVSPEVFASAA